MIRYICKYTPVELFGAYGETCAVLDETPDNFRLADGAAHPNLCGLGKSVIEAALSGEADELVLVNCCDTIRRTYDILKSRGVCRFLYLLDLPHGNEGCQREVFARNLLGLKSAYEDYSGKRFDRDRFFSSFSAPAEFSSGPFVGILGARAGRELEAALSGSLRFPLRNLTCIENRSVVLDAAASGAAGENRLFKLYAGALLGQLPCRRMADFSGRSVLCSDPGIRGIIYHTIKFCDFYGFEFAEIKDKLPVPILKLETDGARLSSGQLETRVEAFSETLSGIERVTEKAPRQPGKRFAAGIDSGSASTDAVIVDSGGNIVSSAVIPTGGGAEKSAEKCLNEALRKAGLRRTDISRIVATGYGRAGIGGADANITEISCHAKGAHRLNPDVRTVIDIGGQDSKVIRLDENGAVKSFVMNDKCAAGTGRFLEMMARTLDLSIDEMSILGLKWKNDITISSTCTVFAESEAVTLVAQNRALPDIIHGLNKSAADRVSALVSRMPPKGAYMITGGVAKNAGVVREIENGLGVKLFVCAQAQICGALGAALFALE